MADHRPAPRRRRLRRPRARAVDAASPRRRCGCSPSRARPRSARASSPTCAGRRCSTTSSSPRPRSRELAKEARPLVRSGGRWVALDQADLDAAAAALAERADTTQLTGADMLRLALGLEGSPARRRHLRRGWRLGGRPARRRGRRCRASRPTAPDGLRRRAAQLPGRGARLARLPRRRPASAAASPSTWAWARRPRCSPTSSPTRRPRSRAGDRAARGRRQLGRGGRALHARPARGRAPRRQPRRRPTRSPTRSPSADVVITTYGTAVRDVDAIAEVQWARVVLDEAQAIKNPAERHRAAAAPDPRAHARRAHRHADRERPRRPLGDPRLHQPRARRAAAAVHRQPVGRRERVAARAGGAAAPSTRCARSTASSCSAAPRPSPTIAGRAARPHRRARPLLDDPRADRPLPGGARQARARHRPARGRGAAQGPDPRRHHRAQADLQPPGRVPGRRPSARGPVGQARPARGDRRRRCSRRASACSCSRTSPSGA